MRRGLLYRGAKKKSYFRYFINALSESVSKPVVMKMSRAIKAQGEICSV